MCGICGIFNFNRQPVDQQLLLNMRDIMTHRGPNDAGIHIDKYVGLAARRLSVIDLSQLGHQPMFNEDKSICICYNGEVYNYVSLREELIKKGHTFVSNTDTEVVLHGFEEYGLDIVRQMNGMFTFAVWDSNTRALFLCRDRLGIKPLYYYTDADRFIFGSEIKAILTAGIRAELEPSVISSFLSLRYTPGNNTIFQGIHKLPPGTFVKVDQQGMGDIQQYWNLLQSDSLLPYSEKEAQEIFWELLDDAVRSRLVADVPVGAFLSGGIDSATITALMRKYQERVDTFTFGFGLDIDETERAKWVADWIGVNNDVVMLNKGDFVYYPTALWHLEEPLGDSIIVPTYLLARSAAEKVTVVQLGEGADEVLGGYVHQLAMTYGDLIGRMVPRNLLTAFMGVVKKFPQELLEPFFPYPAKMGRRGLDNISNYFSNVHNTGRAYFSLAGVFSEDEKRDLLMPDFYHAHIIDNSPEHIFSRYIDSSKNPSFLNKLQQLDLRYWNTDYTMLRMDKLTMAHSLEARVPFLDYRIVEFCLRLPRRFKTKWFEQKRLMREAVKRNRLMPDVVSKAKKKAFFFPVEKGFDNQFDGFIRDVLSEESLKNRGILNNRYVQNLLDHPQRELIHNKQLMVLLVFELWCKMFLDDQWRNFK